MIESSILRSEYYLVLSVDIMGAFDNLATTTIHNVMVENKYPPAMIRWYMSSRRSAPKFKEFWGQTVVFIFLLKKIFNYL